MLGRRVRRITRRPVSQRLQGSFFSPYPLLLSLSLRLPVLIIIYSQTSRALLLLSVMYQPTRAGLPDGPPATTATITAAPNPTQQWAITLDGTVVGGEVSPRPLVSFASIDDGMADWLSLCVGIARRWLVDGIGHFDRRRTGWRSLSKISTIETTLSSSSSIIPRSDPDLIDDTHSQTCCLKPSRQPPSTTFSTPSLSPLVRDASLHVISPTPSSPPFVSS